MATACNPKAVLLLCEETKDDTEVSTYYPKSPIEGHSALVGEIHVVAEVLKGEPGRHSALDGVNKLPWAKSCVLGPVYSLVTDETACGYTSLDAAVATGMSDAAPGETD